ncbi:chemotaxis protein CheD [Acidaminobacter hydrogenoformans]|uniref:Chemotaxis protein CheD n=1 Tax=Acidaminobacter hydrogenoformans DSM 2784 TaxID=1120920 RepID=A0A1G5RUY8_9FIRM|nr:chemotaxis protein CheD [Acidaminobacter hydrogenoformans]SCZ77836.1 chemotaxis protein CheD [Acidaminobacter hydrogenoformans DSM 2784]
MDMIIGIGDYGIIDQPGDRLVTHALASCVAVTFFSQTPKVAAMVHIALPEPPEGQLAPEKPGYYATTGLPLLMKRLRQQYGCRLETMKIHMVGGADSVRKRDAFKIGDRNIEKIHEILRANGLRVSGEELRGTVSRTVVLDLESDAMTIHYQRIVV